MEMYFLKSVACLASFLLFYKLLLEKEDMHVFKRFYLLVAVVVSFAIPGITFTSYVEIPAVPTANFFEVEEAAGAEETLGFGSLLKIILWLLYGLGVLFFGIKFCRNLQEILQKIKENPHVRTGSTTNVLLDEEVAPHTFWNYIFLNRVKFQERQIPVEVFEHEQAHARQRHSLDILLMELLQVIFWFHPLLYLVKRAVKLNHEFLADRAVIKRGIKTSTYQERLLAFSSGAANSRFVNSINYSSIKKRFTVMRTHTSKKAIWARILLLLPLLAVLIYSCSTNEELESSTRDPALQGQSQEVATPEMISEYNKLARKYNSQGDKFIEVGAYKDMRQIYDLMSPEQRKTAEALPEMEVEIIEVVEDEKITSQTLAEYNQLAKFYNKNGVTNENVEDASFKRMMYLYGLMTEAQRKDVEKLPAPPPPARVSEELPPPPPPVVTEEPLPPPPPPPSPEEAIKNWDAEGAEFYFEGKRISAQDALDLVKKEEKLQVTTEENGSIKKIRLSRNKD